MKEGWDNPDVFTICKLRSSGSEISKLQDVRRGLRLPVDSAGNRIPDKAFMLNYIVDFTEKGLRRETRGRDQQRRDQRPETAAVGHAGRHRGGGPQTGQRSQHVP